MRRGLVGLSTVALTVSLLGTTAHAARTPSVASLRSAARAALNAALEGDASTAYGYLSAKCRKTTSEAKFAATLVFGTAFAEGLSKVKLKDFRAGRVETRAVSRKRGQARVFAVDKNGATSRLDNDPDWNIWVYEDGQWRSTDCGSFDSSSADAQARAEYLASVDFSKAPTEIVVDAALGERLDVGDGFTGSYTVTLVDVRDFGPSLTQAPDKYGYGGRAATAKGHFVGVSYRIQNATNGSLSPEEALGGLASITDGKATWTPSRDFYVDSIVENVTGASSANDDLGAGFDATAWVIFDVPTTVKPIGLVLAYDSNSPVMLRLPVPGSSPAVSTQPPSTAPATTLPLPPVTDDPQSYAQYLFVTWQNGNRTAAANVASADAVNQLFAQAYNPATQWQFGMCDPASDSLYCNWNGQGGATVTMTVRTLIGGLPIQVLKVEFS